MEPSLIVSILGSLLTVIGGVIALYRRIGTIETNVAANVATVNGRLDVTNAKLDALGDRLTEHTESDTRNFEALNERLNGSARLYRKASATKRKTRR